MADDENSNAASGDRATIRLVAEMVGGVREQVSGLKSLSEAQHLQLQRQLDPLAGLPVAVADLTARVTVLEAARAYRMGPRTMILLGVGSLLVATIMLVVTLA